MATTTIPQQIIPWEPSSIPTAIQNELNRRKVNRSFNYIQNQTATWDVNGTFQNYKGPMVSWIRLCSNGKGHPNSHGIFDKQRFILNSGKGFYQSYGFQTPNTPNNSKYQIIGYSPDDNSPHIIENSLITPGDEPVNYPINVPPPEISRMEVVVQKELFRRATIEWVCFSWKQLVYMTPYFLVPGITCTLEWGWNHFNVNSLIDLSDKTNLRKLWDNAYPLYTDNIINSCGNYDVVYGLITDFDWSIEGNKILCSTEITSKDKLYAGIAKDNGLVVNNNDIDDPKKSTNPNGIFRSIIDFVSNDNNILNLKPIVTTNPIPEANSLRLQVNTDPRDPGRTNTWFDILNPLLHGGTTDQIGMKFPWVFGFFSGRPDTPPSDSNDIWGNPKSWGQPLSNDFDYSVKTNDVKRMWINMGMAVTILNYFSSLDSGANNGENMFFVDIQNSIISAHPNLISCDESVLIPNYNAPKFLYGFVGVKDNGGLLDMTGGKQTNPSIPNKGKPYTYQVLRGFPVNESYSNPNLTLRNVIQQSSNKICYRNDLDTIINYNVYRFSKIAQKVGLNVMNSYSFPSKITTLLPQSERGLNGNQLIQDYSGLLSNIYISYSFFQDVITDPSNKNYVDIYHSIFEKLMTASGGLWDLSLVDVDGTMTVTDKNHISSYNLDRVYSFDYTDADSIIKSLKFKPVLSEIQATRVIYGSINNRNTKYNYIDKNDLLDYQFDDAIISPSTVTGDPDGELNKRLTGIEQMEDLLRVVQNVNSNNDDPSLQMSLLPNRPGSISPDGTPKDMLEIVKLVLPNTQLLNMLLDDEDDDNNPRYCAVQPGIFLELTLQGIGGLRTFQYFLVKNFPEPYSDRNIIFRITDVHQTVETGNWETLIRAQLSPLKGYIKKRLLGPIINGKSDNGWPIYNTNR